MERRRAKWAREFPMAHVIPPTWSRAQNGPTPLVPVPNTPVELPDSTRGAVGECPNCGRKLGRGGHFHIKACTESSARIGPHKRK